MSERETPARTQSAETQTRELRCIVRSGDNPLFLEDVSNGGRIEAARATQKKRTLQKTYIGFRIHAILTLRAVRSDESEPFCLTRLPAFSKFAGL